MSLEQLQPALMENIESLYSKLGSRPAMFAGRPGCIEAFIFGAEGILDALNDYKPRANSYFTFCANQNFGCERFSSRFEREHFCRLGFISWEKPEIISRAEQLEGKYQEEFETHWNKFLLWKSKQSGEMGGPKENI